jgi:hypothetical protein
MFHLNTTRHPFGRDAIDARAAGGDGGTAGETPLPRIEELCLPSIREVLSVPTGIAGARSSGPSTRPEDEGGHEGAGGGSCRSDGMEHRFGNMGEEFDSGVNVLILGYAAASTRNGCRKALSDRNGSSGIGGSFIIIAFCKRRWEKKTPYGGRGMKTIFVNLKRFEVRGEGRNCR